MKLIENTDFGLYTGFVLTASNGNIMVYNFNPNVLKIIGNVFQNPELL